MENNILVTLDVPKEKWDRYINRLLNKSITPLHLIDKALYESIPLKELHKKYKDYLTEEQNKEFEQLIKDGQD